MFTAEQPPKDALKKTFEAYLAKLKKATKPIIDKNAGKLAGDLAKITPPMVNGSYGAGATGQAYYAGERSLRSDINRAFKPLQSIPFASLIKGRRYSEAALYKFKFDNPRLAKAYAQGNWQTIYHAFSRSEKSKQFAPASRGATSIVQAPTSGLHNRVRDKRTGRVPKNVTPVLVVGGQKAIDQYIRQKAKKIGTMVSGWVDIAKRLKSGIGVPWARQVAGKITYTNNNNEVGIAIENKMFGFNGYANRVKSIADLAIKRWSKQASTDIEAFAKKEASKSITLPNSKAK